MTTYEVMSEEFVSSIGKKTKLNSLYDRWLGELFKSKPWDEKQELTKEVMRFNWESSEKVFENLKEIFNLSGLYIFGTKDNVPIYLGISGKNGQRPLKTRLRSRYFGGPREGTIIKKYSQFQIAKKYEKELKEKGYEKALPKEFLQWYNENFKSKVRFEHAEKLAKFGTDGMWFSVLPISDGKEIVELEKRLINIANDWNKNRNYSTIMNTHHIKE